SYAGAGGKIIRSLSSSGNVDGIIIAGTGAGRCSYEEEKAASEAQKKGIQIVMGSRCAHGRVVPLEKDEHLAAPTADNLSPQKALNILMVALAKFKEHTQLQDVFNTSCPGTEGRVPCPHLNLHLAASLFSGSGSFSRFISKPIFKTPYTITHEIIPPVF